MAPPDGSSAETQPTGSSINMDGSVLSAAPSNKLSNELSNENLIPNAGKVELPAARMWGAGIVEDIADTAGTWWIKEMTNFNQKTVAGTCENGVLPYAR